MIGGASVESLGAMDIERLINRHKDAVYRQMVRTCGNYDDAEDALADALLSALKASDQLRDPSHFQAWLARIGTRSCARMRIRQRLVSATSLAELEEKGFEIPEGDLTPDQLAEISGLKECVSGAIQLLPPAYRDVYLRREILEEPAETVARDMNLSIPALKSRLHRARALMRDHLDLGLGCVMFLDSATQS